MGQNNVKVDHLKAPYDKGRTANDFGGRKYTATTTSAANALPAEWSEGILVEIFVTGGIVHFGFTQNSSSQEVDRAVTATAAGATAKVGRVIPDGETRTIHLPKWNPGETVYFVREASATTDVYISPV
jgi:hypothetical protein